MEDNPKVVLSIDGQEVEDKGLLDRLLLAVAQFFEEKKEEDVAVDELLAENGLIQKSLNDELRQGTFVVLEPNVVDLHSDTYDENEVRKACHNFNTFCEKAYIDHKQETEDMRFLESYIAPDDMSINGVNVVKGTWLAVCEFSPELWEEVKADPKVGLSIGCYAKAEYL